MSTVKITRPTTAADRTKFASLTAGERVQVVTAARVAASAGATSKEAWATGFGSLVKRTSGIAGKHFQRAVGHRLTDLRTTTAHCSCGKAKYKGEDLRGQHASHKVKVAA